MTDPTRDDIQTLRDAMQELAQALGHTDADVIEARAALSRLEALRDAARDVVAAMDFPHPRDDGWEDPDTGEWVSRPSKSYQVMGRNSRLVMALREALAACDNETSQP